MTDWISPEVFLFLLKGALLMILGLLLPGVMRRSSATFRHAMMASWFGALLLLPVASGLLPRWNLPVPGWLAGAEETSWIELSRCSRSDLDRSNAGHTITSATVQPVCMPHSMW